MQKIEYQGNPLQRVQMQRNPLQKKQFFIFLFCFFSVSIFAGCTSSKSLENNLSSLKVALGADGSESKEADNALRARKMKKRLLAIDGIKGCHVVISGRTALIAIEPIATDLGEIDQLKKEASKEARLCDERIVSTAITANTEIGCLIAEMEQEKEALL